MGWSWVGGDGDRGWGREKGRRVWKALRAHSRDGRSRLAIIRNQSSVGRRWIGGVGLEDDDDGSDGDGEEHGDSVGEENGEDGGDNGSDDDDDSKTDISSVLSVVIFVVFRSWEWFFARLLVEGPRK